MLELDRLLARRADVAAAVGERFGEVLADELEDAGIAHRRMLDAIAPHGNVVCACDPAQATRRWRGGGAAALAAFRAAHPEAGRDRPR